jgi:putative transposase
VEHETHAWFVHILLLMPDHLHALIPFSEKEKRIQTSMASWKSFAAKTMGIRWQTGFFEHRLRSDENLQEKWAYIRNNPVRAGLATDPEEWPHVFVGG